MSGIKPRAFLWCLLALLLGAYLITLAKNNTLNLDSNILSLLPATEADPAVEQAFTNFSEQTMRRLVFLVANTDKAAAMRSADELANALQTNRFIESVELKRGTSDQATTGDFFFRHRHHLLSKSDQALLAAGDFTAFSDQAIQQAYAPFSGGLIALLQNDPFLLSFRNATATASNNQQSLALDDGYLVAQDDGDYYVLVTAELARSSFDQEVQLETLAGISSLEANWSASANDSRLIRTGALFYAAHAYETARREVNIIGGGSMVLVLLLMLLAFRSVGPLILVSIALGFGVATGFVLVRLLFGEVHLLTLVFGASLIGVAEDYAFHYFALEEERSGAARLKHILPAISLGLLTCVIGYAALLVTPFPGLQQMAVFSISGLIGAYLTVVLLFPVIPLHDKNSPWLLALCKRLIALSSTKGARYGFYLALVFPLFALASLYYTENAPEDVRSFQALNAELLSQEESIQNLLNAPAANQFYLVKGASPDELLTNLEAAEDKLSAMVAADVIDGFVNIAGSLPSVEQQMRNYELYSNLYNSDAGRALIDAGLLTEEQLAKAKTAFESDSQNYLDAAEWKTSPIGKELAYLWLDPAAQTQADNNSSGYAAVIALRNVKQLDQMADFATGAGGQAVFVDKVSTVNSMLSAYRHNIGWLLFVTCSLIFVILLWRYRLHKALLILTVPVIAISTTVIVLALIGENLSLFHVLPFFLLVGLGVDFGIFFAEDGSLSSSTLLTVLLSALTTLFSFGLLTLSTTLAIHSFGLSMLIGLTCDLLLSPIAGNMLVKQREFTHAGTTG
ncbi:MAG: MMPL family transporter [Pseudomonadota bacterium]